MNITATEGGGRVTRDGADTTVSTDSPTTPQERPWHQQLAIPRTLTRLRRECIEDGRPITWTDALDAFDAWLRDQRDYARADWCELDHRFTRRKCDQRSGVLCGVDRHLQNEYDDLHTVSLTLRGNQYNAAGGFRCPIDHYDEVTASNGNVRDALNHHLDVPHVRLTVLGAHKQGYIHPHWFFWCDGRPSREPFIRALQAHLRNSPVALAHEHDPEDAIEIQRADPDPKYDYSDSDTYVTRLVHEASSQLPWPDHDLLDAEPHDRRAASILWAKHYARQWRGGSDFNSIRDDVQAEWVERHSDEDTDEGEDTEIDYEDFEDADEPTVEIEPHAWGNSIDPLDRDG